jgi:hypothetical protein
MPKTELLRYVKSAKGIILKLLIIELIQSKVTKTPNIKRVSVYLVGVEQLTTTEKNVESQTMVIHLLNSTQLVPSQMDLKNHNRKFC